MSRDDAKEDAARLVELAASGKIASQGAWVSWCDRARRLPYRIRRGIWKQLMNVMDGDTIGYLKSWVERSGGNR